MNIFRKQNDFPPSLSLECQLNHQNSFPASNRDPFVRTNMGNPLEFGGGGKCFSGVVKQTEKAMKNTNPDQFFQKKTKKAGGKTREEKHTNPEHLFGQNWTKWRGTN